MYYFQSKCLNLNCFLMYNFRDILNYLFLTASLVIWLKWFWKISSALLWAGLDTWCYLHSAHSTANLALRTIGSTHMRCCRNKVAASIIKNPTIWPMSSFPLLPFGRRYRSLNSHTTGFRNSYLHIAISVLNQPAQLQSHINKIN